MGLKALRQRDSDLKAEIVQAKKDRAAIGTAAVAEKRQMTDAERASFVQLGQTIDRLDAELAENTMLLQAAEEANEAERTMAAEPPARAPHVEVGVENITKAPGFFGRQLMAVRSFYVNGGWNHISGDEQKALRVANPHGINAAATGLNTDVNSEGGFLVGSERSNTVLQRAYSQGAILSRVRRQPIGAGSNGMTFPAIDETSRADGSRFGGVSSAWAGQGNSTSAGKPKYREMSLKLKKLLAFVYATDEMLQDATATEGWINQNLPNELSFRIEDAIINGTGANQPYGVLTSGAIVSVTRNTASKVIFEDIKSMWYRMWAGSRANAIWICEQSVEPELDVLSVPVGTGGALAQGPFKAAGSAPGQTTATLYGRPVFPVEYCAALGTVGDIVLFDPSEYVFIDKGGVDQAVSIHVSFLNGESVFRFTTRVDGQLAWNAALTPKSGGSTLSCAVSLT